MSARRKSATRWAFVLFLAALATAACIGVVAGDRAAAAKAVQPGGRYLLIF